MTVTQKINRLRSYRNSLRRQIRQARTFADPTDRRHLLDQLSLALKLSDAEWTALHAQAGRTLPGKPVKVGYGW